jgi:hypothetical protein
MQQPMYQEPAKSSKLPWVILGAVVVVLLVVGVLFRDKLFGSKTSQVKGTSTSMGTSSEYQAVFLTNGQVYFGKIKGTDDNYLTLSDIYYLQVIQPPLQGSGQDAAGQPTTAEGQQPQISLVKLGQELHGPVDEMHINRSQVLFYEDLKTDGSVVKAITEDKAKQQ